MLEVGAILAFLFLLVLFGASVPLALPDGALRHTRAEVLPEGFGEGLRVRVGETAHEFHLPESGSGGALTILMDLEVWIGRTQNAELLVKIHDEGREGEVPFFWRRPLGRLGGLHYRWEMAELEISLADLDLPEDRREVALVAEVFLDTDRDQVPLCTLRRRFAAAPVSTSRGVTALAFEPADTGEILLLLPAEGVEAVAVCQICGDPCEGRPRKKCPRCGVPHHLDCWDFAGKCSVYGCGGT